MTVQELMEALNKVKDKGSQVYNSYGYLIEEVEEEEDGVYIS